MTGRPQVVVVTGMSGAGRSTAADVLEDLGYFVVDNIPPSLISEVVTINDLTESPRQLAVVVDSRGGFALEELTAAIYDLMGQGVGSLVFFLDASDETLIKRYKENRRPHPLGLDSITDSIAAERDLFVELRAASDVVVDTTEMNVHQLRERIEEHFREAIPERPMQLTIRSFGFKHGTPRDADMIFDVRFLPNPYWEEQLRELTGQDQAVRDFVMSNEDAKSFVDQVEQLLGFLIPKFQAEGKSYVSVAVGCTGGRHRSVAVAEELGSWLEAEGVIASVRHRDVG